MNFDFNVLNINKPALFVAIAKNINIKFIPTNYALRALDKQICFINSFIN